MRLPQFYTKVLSGTLVAGTWYSTWLFAGTPGSGVSPSTYGPQGNFFTCASSQVQGQLAYINTGGTDTNYLARFSGMSTQTGSVILADRIWADSLNWTDTGKFPIYSGSFMRGAGIGGGDSSGKGICLALEVYTSVTAGSAAAHKVTYIDSAGTADTATLVMTLPTTATAGTFIPFYQGANHTGFRQVYFWHNIATSKFTAGTYGLVAYRPLAIVQCASANVTDWVDAITSGFPITFQNTVPMLLWIAGTTTAPNLFGQFIQAHG
jgi:hypothetical protein